VSRLPNVGLEALYAEAQPGRCLACDAPLPPRQGRERQRVMCDDPECRRVYHRAYRVGRSRREGRKERGEVPQESIPERSLP